MYCKEDLERFEYFNSLLKYVNIDYMIDPLTGLISRKYMLEFIQSLIQDNATFTMAILDLDNFKDINDNFGHIAGDIVLETTGKELITFLNGNGVAGRYGGDEFILVMLNISKYDEVHDFYDKLFHSDLVVRKTYRFNDTTTYLTATIGSASYPANAKTFDELFSMCDKTLYRGKMKGRNCYIIYVHEKHKDLEIQKLVNDDDAVIVYNIYQAFNHVTDIKTKLEDASQYLKKTLRLDYILYIDANGDLYKTSNMKKLGSNIDLSNTKFKNGVYTTNYRNDLNVISHELYISTRRDNVSSTIITSLKTKKKDLGYIMFALERTSRIWQSNEIAILMYLSKCLTLALVE